MDHQADIDAIGGIEAVPTILNVISLVTGMRFVAIARVTEDRWICCAAKDEIDFGLKPGGELKIETTICNEARQSGQPVVIDHVAEDGFYCGHQIPALYGFQSCISVPIVLRDGNLFGTLCAIDPKPALLNTPQTVGMFKLFAELIASNLAVTDRLAISQAELLTERRVAELREQFIAVLGHDLRNPLASIDAGTKLLQKSLSDEKAISIIVLMHKSVARMSELINNVLDFARGRLGGGLTLIPAQIDLAPVLMQVIGELRSAYPERVIQADIDVTTPVVADHLRIAQLLSNLLGNALTYGDENEPVRIRATTTDHFELSVCNAGKPIPAATMGRLFSPFSRGDGQTSQQGLGLGLFIVSEIARAHGGTINATSLSDETCFTFKMPLSR